MELLKDVVIECEECNNQMKINKDEINQELHYLIRNMSVERRHDFTGVYSCDKCKNKISFEVKGIEFPQKYKHHQVNEITGGLFVRYPKVEIVLKK